jgi:hypothetical protein
MDKEITITRYELFPKEEPIGIIVGFIVALKNDEILPYNTTFYLETIVSKDLIKEEAINQAWLQLKEEATIRTEELRNAATEEAILQNPVGQVFTPLSDEENE